MAVMDFATHAPVLDERDLDDVIEMARSDLHAWQGSRMLITGATGFVGSWLLATLVRAIRDHDLDLDVVALARRPQRLPAHVTGSASVTTVAADVRRLDAASLQRIGRVDSIVHLACPSVVRPDSPDSDDPGAIPATVVDGGHAVLRAAASSGGARVLIASSGAVHGFGPDRPARVPEDCACEPRSGDPSAAYGIAKRAAERAAVAASMAGDADAVIARLWTFVGPLLPLDAHFAAGNFIADALAGRAVTVKGDPATVRSYLYPVDLVVWLVAVLTRGRRGVAYNVGSKSPTTIGELATSVANLSGNSAGVRLAAPSESRSRATRYVPDTSRAREELAVRQTVGLDDAIERTLAWHRLHTSTWVGGPS